MHPWKDPLWPHSDIWLEDAWKPSVICLEDNAWKCSLKLVWKRILAVPLCYFFRMEFLWIHYNICLKKCLRYISIICLIENTCEPCPIFVWKRMFGNPLWHLFGRECLKVPSEICLEKNPCNASLNICECILTFV